MYIMLHKSYIWRRCARALLYLEVLRLRCSVQTRAVHVTLKLYGECEWDSCRLMTRPATDNMAAVENLWVDNCIIV